MHQCDTCGVSTSKLCGGCKNVAYCSVPCQAKKWDEHKTLCNAFSRRMKSIEQCIKSINTSIQGNIMIMISHKFANHGGVIDIHIDEDIDSVLVEDSIHFAQLSGRIWSYDYINVVYTTRDYQHTIKYKIPSSDVTKVIKNKYTAPPDVWTITFNT